MFIIMNIDMIKQGTYYIKGKPLSQSTMVTDLKSLREVGEISKKILNYLRLAAFCELASQEIFVNA